MRWIFLQPDGAADEPQPSLSGKTPLEYASTPYLDLLSEEGFLYQVETIPEGFSPGSDIGNLTLLGYDPGKYYGGRAPLEAASQRISLKDGEVVFRMNLITLEGDEGEEVMADFSAGHITSEEAGPFLKEFAEILPEGKIYGGVGYRNLFVTEGSFPDLVTTPPHEIQGKKIASYLPRGNSSEKLIAWMRRGISKMRGHPYNLKRVSQGKPPVSGFWLWGHGYKISLPSFSSLYGREGVVVSEVDLVQGIGVLAGMKVVKVEGTTGFLDTNYEGMVEGALKSGGDFVFLHLEAPDECSHMGDPQKKVKSIELFDSKMVRPIYEYAKEEKVGIVVCPDHPTLLRTRGHGSFPVPCLVWHPHRKNFMKGRRFTESHARETPLLSGLTLLSRIFSESLPYF